MPKICYVEKRFNASSQAVIAQANAILAEYAQQGYDITLRQLYYQFVSRDFIANNQREYKRLGSIINDARLAGRIDWSMMVDRTRNLHDLPRWTSPGQIVRACAEQFRRDLWEGQPCRVEVWAEKEALAGVFIRVCDELRLPYFSCRGYVSQSEMWEAANRLKRYDSNHQKPVILHFGDHDPSGIDMSRDIEDRLAVFGCRCDFRRLALNMAQVEEYGPPPNPAKMSDSRAEDYVENFGEESWELDALDPATLAGLVRTEVESLVVEEAWENMLRQEESGRDQLRQVADSM